MKKKKTTSSILRHRLQLQAESETPDGAGGYARSWSSIDSVWAQIIPMRGNERVFAARLQAETTHKVRIRYRSDVTARHRLVLGSRVFSIHSIRNIDELDDVLEITVVEGEQP